MKNKINWLTLIIFVSAVTLLLAGLFGYKSYVMSMESIEMTQPLSEHKVWLLVQDWRGSVGKSPYIEDPLLCTYAERRLTELNGDFSHDKFYLTSDEIYENSDFSSVGENLARLYYREQDVLDGWLASPSHRENLDMAYTHSCIRCGRVSCVQLFASY